MERLHTLQPTLIVLEATDGLETELAGALAAVGLSVLVINPRQVREFSFPELPGSRPRTIGTTHSSSRNLLKRFSPWSALCPMSIRRRWRRWLPADGKGIKMLMAEENRLRMAARSIQKRLQTHITWLERELATTARQEPKPDRCL